jgi:hypothetical protein
MDAIDERMPVLVGRGEITDLDTAGFGPGGHPAR